MNTNDHGREPTDAELLRDFEAADVRLSNACENCMDFTVDGDPTDPEYLDAEHEWKLCSERRETRGREYLSGARPMPDTPAPDEERRTVCVYDKNDPDYVYRPDESGEYRMQVDRRSGTTPATPVLGANQCEHGHLARVCVTCELIAAEARIADLERENAALRAELSNIVNAKRFDLKVFDDDSGFADWAQSRARFTLAAGSAGKEAPDAE